MSYVLGLKCKECGHRTAVSPVHVCEQCFGPYEVEYDYAKMKGKVTRESIAKGPKSLWRYHDLLPVDVPRTVPQRDAPAAVHAANVAACNSGDDPLDWHSRNALGFFNRAPHRSCRRADVGNQSFAQAFGFRRAHGHKLRTRFVQLADDGARFRAPNIQRNQILFFFCQPAAPSTQPLPGPRAWA